MTINTEHRPRRDLDDVQVNPRRPAPGAHNPEQPTSGPTPPTLPHDQAAEQCVLGGMLLSKDTIGEVIDILAARDFYRPIHATIYDAILDLYGRGEPTVANAPWHARNVKDFAEQRRLIEIGTKVTQIGYQGRLDPDDDPIDRAGQLFFDAIGDTDTGTVTIGELVRETLEEIDAAGKGADPDLTTGLYDLDDLLNGGLRGGQLVLIAGRPGSGKSVLTMDIARHNALRHGKGVEVFNLEMGRSEVLMRVLAAETGVPFNHLRRGHVDEAGWTAINRKGSDISESGLHIDDFANQTLTSIRARARKRAQRGTLDLIVVDYLQLLTTGRRVESRQQEVAEISRGLKLLAKELNVPVIACSQLNRGNEQRSDKRPQLSDLRESGAQEQDADIVILLHRPDYHDKECERAGEADLIVAKHRGGATDTVTVAAQLNQMRFASFALEN